MICSAKKYDMFFSVLNSKLSNFDDKNDSLHQNLTISSFTMMTIGKFKMTCIAKAFDWYDNDMASSMYKNTIMYSILFSEPFDFGQNGSLFEGNILALDGFCW